MQKPSVRRGTLPEHPQPYTVAVDRGVVIARDLTSIPPSGLDALGLTRKTQRPATARQTIRRSERLRCRQKPQGALRPCPARLISGAITRCAPRRDWRRTGHYPGAFRPVFLTQRKAIHGLGTQARAQAIDEAIALLTRLTAVLTRLPQAAAGRQLRHQLIRTQLARAYRCRQPQRIQVLAEKCSELLLICTWRRQGKHAAGRRGLPVYEPAFELHHSALPRGEKSSERGDEGHEFREQLALIAELAVELAAAAKAYRRLKSRPQIAGASGERIELGELRHTEAACKAGARQAQHGSNGAYAGARQACACFFGPTQRLERQRRELSYELREVGDYQRLAGARRGERRERCRGECEHRPNPKTQALLHELTPQTGDTREQVQTPRDFEQQAIRRRETHTRREALGAGRQLFESLRRVEFAQMHTGPKLGCHRGGVQRAPHAAQ